MSNYLTITNTLTGVSQAVPDFTADPTDVAKNLVMSTNKQYLGATVFTLNGSQKSHSAFVRNLQTNSVVRIIGHQYQESDAVTLVFDPTSRFGCFIDNTRFLMVFDLETGTPVKLNISPDLQLCRWVGATFDPVRQKLYLAYVKEEDAAAEVGDSGIAVLDLLVYAIETRLGVRKIFKNESGYQLPTHCKMTVSHDGSELIIPNVNSSAVKYNLNSHETVNLGYSDNEQFTFGVRSKLLTVKHPISKPMVLNYPSLRIREELPEMDAVTYDDLKIQDGILPETPYSYIESSPTQYINSFSAVNYQPDQYFYDPVTKTPVCFKPSLINHSVLPAPNKPTDVLDLYTKLCNGLGLNPTVSEPTMLNDDTAVVRTTLVTPFNTLGFTNSAPLVFTVSADSGFALHLRNMGQVPSYVAPIFGRASEAIRRASFKTLLPPFLMMNAKPKDWDVRIVDYREQKSSQYTIAYMQYQEIYGNYPGTREMLMLIGSNGRIDYAISRDATELSKARFLIFNDTSNLKYVTSLYGGFTEPSDQYDLKWFSNASRFGIDPLDFIR